MSWSHSPLRCGSCAGLAGKCVHLGAGDGAGHFCTRPAHDGIALPCPQGRCHQHAEVSGTESLRAEITVRTQEPVCLMCGCSLGGAFGIIVMIFQWRAGKVNGLGMVPCGYVNSTANLQPSAPHHTLWQGDHMKSSVCEQILGRAAANFHFYRCLRTWCT